MITSFNQPCYDCRLQLMCQKSFILSQFFFFLPQIGCLKNPGGLHQVLHGYTQHLFHNIHWVHTSVCPIVSILLNIMTLKAPTRSQWMGHKNTTQDNFPANDNYLVFGFSLLTLQGWFLVEVGPDWKAPRARLPGIPTGLYQTGPPQLKLSQSQFASGLIQFYGSTVLWFNNQHPPWGGGPHRSLHNCSLLKRLVVAPHPPYQ